MSLFGDPSPTESTPAPATSKSLFGNEPAAASSTSLFDDDANGSPWSMPTPKKQARQNLLKSLLPATDVPESYIDAFDTVVEDEGQSAVSYEIVESILRSASLSVSDRTRILGFVAPSGQDGFNSLGRSEFNVLLALVGLAQEGEELSLDSVDDRRRRLPQPKVPYIDQLRSKAEQQQQQRPPAPAAEAPKQIPPKQQKSRQDSFGDDPTVDPWGSPTNKRAPPSSTAAPTMQEPNGFDDASTNARSNGIERTTSTFTTQSVQASSSGTSPTANRDPGSMGGAGWGSYNGSSGGFSEQPTLGGGFADSGEDGSDQPGHRAQPAIGGSVVVPPGTGESVSVTLLPGKEGMFLFQHHNYEVKTIRRGSSVVRRYSDFVWLLDCLQKRYPFRRLPLLPPKRVQVNGTHLAGDISGFLEKRRRGLVRFSNQLVQHPVLSQETLVVMFLTVPTYQELAVWRKQATISVQEEFVGKALPPALEDSLPSTLSELFEQVRAGVKRSAEIYINLCVLLERLVKRNEGLAADSSKFSLALQSLTESSKDTYAIDANDVPLLNDGINAVSKHLSSTQTLLDDEGQAWEQNTLEDLKTIRDSMVSMRDMFDRRDRYARDNIPQLERRIEASEAKLQQLRGKPAGTIKPGEIERVESSIISDKDGIVQQHARGVLIKECVRDEIVTFQTTIHSISRFHQEWAQERVKYAELQASNWRQLVDSVESMPMAD